MMADEQRCLSQCMTLYMAAFDQVSKSYVARVTRERGAGGAGGGPLM
jgi:import inner membrane translocase subunit TIM13